MDPQILPDDARLLRLADVLALVRLSKSTWQVGVKEGRFPQPVRLGKKAVVWRMRDIRDFIDALR